MKISFKFIMNQDAICKSAFCMDLIIVIDTPLWKIFSAVNASLRCVYKSSGETPPSSASSVVAYLKRYS